MRLLLKYQQVLVVMFFLLVAIVITYPLILHMGSRSTGLGDELLLAWIQQWVVHILFSNPFQLFEAPIFFPYTHTIAYSDLLLTSSLFAAFPSLLIGEPIAFQNVTLISSLWLLGTSIYFMTRYFVKDVFLSVLSGLLVIFSPVVLEKYVHLQILFIFFVPLSYLFFFHFLKTGRSRFLFLTLLCFIFQTLNSFLPGYFILFGLITIYLVYFLRNKKKAVFFSKYQIAMILISICVIAPFTLPYFQVSREFGYTRDIRDAIHFAIQPEDLYYADSFTRLSPILEWISHKDLFSKDTSFKNGFPGVVLSILIFFSAYMVIRYRKLFTWQEISIFLIAVLGLVLSLGPALHIGRATIHHPFPIPLPYSVLYYLVPGFNGMRNSARWEVLFIMMVAVGSVIVLSKLFSRLSRKKRFIITLLLILAVCIEYKPSFRFFAVPPQKDFPSEYAWISTLPKNAVIVEMPIYNWNAFPYATDELQRQYFSTVHFRKSLNGASGFSPPPWQDYIQNIFATFPSEESIISLKARGIMYIIVHTDDYDRLHQDRYVFRGRKFSDGRNIIKQMDKMTRVEKVKEFTSAVIYKIL